MERKHQPPTQVRSHPCKIHVKTVYHLTFSIVHYIFFCLHNSLSLLFSLRVFARMVIFANKLHLESWASCNENLCLRCVRMSSFSSAIAAAVTFNNTATTERVLALSASLKTHSSHCKERAEQKIFPCDGFWSCRVWLRPIEEDWPPCHSSTQTISQGKGLLYRPPPVRK